MAHFYDVFTLQTTLKNMLMVNLRWLSQTVLSGVRKPRQEKGGIILPTDKGQRKPYRYCETTS